MWIWFWFQVIVVLFLDLLLDNSRRFGLVLDGSGLF